MSLIFIRRKGDVITGQMILEGNGVTYFKERPRLELSRVLGVNKPTIVYRGMIRGFSLPIYNNDNEELFFDLPCVPQRWDESSNPLIYVGGYLADAQVGNGYFQIACDWAFFSPNTDLSSSDAPTGSSVETVKSGNILAKDGLAQYTSWYTTFEINYDIASPNILASDDCMTFRLYRVATDNSASDIDGEVVVTGCAIKWKMNKYYSDK